MPKKLQEQANRWGQTIVETTGAKLEHKPPRAQQYLALLVALATPFLAPAVSGVSSQDAFKSWYRTLNKPAWSPPGWVFAPVWTILYLSMGVASWLVWRRGQSTSVVKRMLGDDRKQAANKALTLYGLQLLLNAAWTPIFFGLRRLDLALVEIIVLWGALFATTVSFFRVRPAAGWLLVPYQMWVSFAGVLNGVIWWRNR